MEKLRIILFYIIFNLTLPVLKGYSQTLSDDQINKIAEQVNRQMKGVDIGNGIIVKGCLSIGRTLIFQCTVPANWEAPGNIKEEIISNLKTTGNAKTYFINNIDVDFYYYKGNSIVKKVSVKSNEFSPINISLGEYISTNGHPKAKEVALKIKVPVGWEFKEGDRPNVIWKFVNNGNTYLILIKDNTTFFSRKQVKEALQDDDYINGVIQDESSSFKNYIVTDKSIVTIDKYPAIQFRAEGQLEHSGITISVFRRCWVVFYEDKIIYLQGMGHGVANYDSEFRALEQIYFLITNSLIFPEQYN